MINKVSKELKKLNGANMDISLVSSKKIHWKQDKCPWAEADNKKHKCAIKNVSLCKYFKGIEYPDKVICAYKNKSKK